MAVQDLKIQLNRDAFNNPDISKEELFRRLSELTDFIWTMMSQIQGDQIVNNNVTISGSSSSVSGATTTKVAFNVDGTNCFLVFINGALQP